MTYLIVSAYLALINTVAFLVFRADKRRAEADAWRVPETHLLMLSFCGGWFGAKLAQIRFRHKTRKQPFKALLNGIPVAWALIVGVPTLATHGPSLGTFAAGAAVNLSFEGGSVGAGQRTSNGWMKSRDAKETPRFFQRASE